MFLKFLSLSGMNFRPLHFGELAIVLRQSVMPMPSFTYSSEDFASQVSMAMRALTPLRKTPNWQLHAYRSRAWQERIARLLNRTSRRYPICWSSVPRKRKASIRLRRGVLCEIPNPLPLGTVMAKENTVFKERTIPSRGAAHINFVAIERFGDLRQEMFRSPLNVGCERDLRRMPAYVFFTRSIALKQRSMMEDESS